MKSNIFWIYNEKALEGEPGYSSKVYMITDSLKENTNIGMKEWISEYYITKLNPYDFSINLCENWWISGGPIESANLAMEVPKEWFKLEYKQFLDYLVTLARAKHYGITSEQLYKVKGLKQFLGY